MSNINAEMDEVSSDGKTKTVNIPEIIEPRAINHVICFTIVFDATIVTDKQQPAMIQTEVNIDEALSLNALYAASFADMYSKLR